jgi:hypothetical protein
MKDTPAFPHTIEHLHEPQTTGMTLRDYFAAKAMQGELSCQSVDGSARHDINKLAVHAYRIADSMLKARGQ